jgi:hypothetical protein
VSARAAYVGRLVSAFHRDLHLKMPLITLHLHGQVKLNQGNIPDPYRELVCDSKPISERNMTVPLSQLSGTASSLSSNECLIARLGLMMRSFFAAVIPRAHSPLSLGAVAMPAKRPGRGWPKP